MKNKEEIWKGIPEMDERLAQAYLRDIYVDYGDLSEKAEVQIKEAFKAGLNFARPEHPSKPVTPPYLGKYPEQQILSPNDGQTFLNKDND